MSQFLALVQRVRQETGTAGTGPSTVVAQKGQLAQLVTWVAQAYLDICNKWDDWDFLWAEGSLPVEGGATDYDLEDDLRRINEDAFYIYGGDFPDEGVRLDSIDFDKYRALKTSNQRVGPPIAFTILPSGKIRLIPIPDQAYICDYEYWREPEVLSTDASAPAFSEIYEDAIIWRACWFWASFNEASAEMSAHNFNYEQALNNIEARYLPAMNKYQARSQNNDLVVVAE